MERLVGAIERDGQGKRPACRACQGEVGYGVDKRQRQKGKTDVSFTNAPVALVWRGAPDLSRGNLEHRSKAADRPLEGKRRRQSVVFESSPMESSRQATQRTCVVCGITRPKVPRRTPTPRQPTRGGQGLGRRGPKQCQCALAGPRRRREISLKSYYISMTLPLGGCRDRGYRPRSGGQALFLFLPARSTMRERCAQFLALGQVSVWTDRLHNDTVDSASWFCFVLHRQGTYTQEVGRLVGNYGPTSRAEREGDFGYNPTHTRRIRRTRSWGRPGRTDRQKKEGIAG